MIALFAATVFAMNQAPVAGAQDAPASPTTTPAAAQASQSETPASDSAAPKASEAAASESEAAPSSSAAQASASTTPSSPSAPAIAGLKPTDNSKVSITNITITEGAGAKKRGDGALYQNQPVDVKIEWEAIGQVKEGDSFTLQFPKFFPLTSAIEAKLVDETSDLNGGNCVLTDQFTLTCTFNDNFKNKDQVHGTVSFQGQPRANESGTVDIQITDGPKAQPRTQTVSMPKVLPDLTRTPERTYRKSGEVQPDGKTIAWEIWIPYGKFANAKEIVITDELSGSHKYNGVFNAIQYGENWVATDSYRIPDGNVDFVATDTGATITIPKPADGWKEGWDLRFWYQTTYTGEGLPALGTTFGNEATAFDETAEATASYNAAIAATIQGVDRGSFELTKELEGDDRCKKDISGQEFTVEVTLNVKDSVNPKFDFAGTKEAKGVEAADGILTYTDKIVAGTALKGYDSPPKNSTITIREVKPAEVKNVCRRHLDPARGCLPAGLVRGIRCAGIHGRGGLHRDHGAREPPEPGAGLCVQLHPAESR